MRRSLGTLPLIVLAFLLVSGCAGAAKPKDAPVPVAEATPETGGIEGLVITDEYQPISGADVSLIESGEKVKSSAEGAFAFSKLDPGRYVVGALRIGYFQATRPVEVRPGEIAQIRIALEAIPIAEPPFDVLQTFTGTLLVGTAAGGPEPIAGQGIDTMDYKLPILATKEDGTVLAAVYTKIQLNASESPGAIDLDLYLLDSKGTIAGQSTSSGAHELIEVMKILAPGDYTARVYFWAGAKADFTLRTLVTYEQGEAAEYAMKHGGP